MVENNYQNPILLENGELWATKPPLNYNKAYSFPHVEIDPPIKGVNWNVWDKLDEESGYLYNCFHKFCELGPERTYKKLEKALREESEVFYSQDNDRRMTKASAFGQPARLFLWKWRAEQYDIHMIKVSRKIREKKFEKFIDEEFDTLMDVNKKINANLNDLVSADNAPTVKAKAMKENRLAHTSNLKNIFTVAGKAFTITESKNENVNKEERKLEITNFSEEENEKLRKFAKELLEPKKAKNKQ